MDFLLDDTKKRPGKNPELLFLRLLPLAQVVVHLLVLLVVLGLRLPHPVIAALQGHQFVVAADFPDAAGPSAERLKRGAGAKSDDLLPKPLLAKKKKKTDPPPSEGGKSAFAAINKILLKSGVPLRLELSSHDSGNRVLRHRAVVAARGALVKLGLGVGDDLRVLVQVDGGGGDDLARGQAGPCGRSRCGRRRRSASCGPANWTGR